ncbi:MAG: hypothetical protein JWP13_924 [Candidatus Saccharibacteria bacterium]|nr:hypothetical protein [Candidatus Saccharibacteria bacterium]
MVYYSRALLSGRQKLALSIAVIVLAVYLVFNPRAMEVFLAFCLGGIVPGTDIVLSPDVLLGGVVGLSVMLLGGAILRMKLRSTRRRREVSIPVRVVSQKRIPVVEASDHVTVADVEPAAAVSRRENKPSFITSVLRTIRGGMANVMVITGHGIRAAYRALTVLIFTLSRGVYAFASVIIRGTYRFVYGVVLLVGVGVHKIAVCLSIIASALLAAIITLGRWVMKNSIELWKWSQPRLLKIDEWLELRVRRGEAFVRRTLRRYEFARLAHTIIRQSRKSLAELSPRLILQSIRKKIASIKE